MKKVSDVFKSIRFAKGEPRGKPHSSTDEEEHGAVGEKEFNQQIQHVKKRAMQEEKKDKYDEGEYDQEGDMVKSDLRSIMANAQKLHDMIDDAENLPEWCQNKVTLAEDYISTVANYMTAEMNEAVKIPKTAHERFKERMKKAGYDMDAGAKRLQDLLDKQKKEREEREQNMKEETELEEAKKKPNATTRHLRQYPVSDKDVAKPVKKKEEKKKPEQGVAEGYGPWGKKSPEVIDKIRRALEKEKNNKPGQLTKSLTSPSKARNIANRDDFIARTFGEEMAEETEYLEEKNKPTNPELWARAVSMARSKFDVYPSAYANGWAAKWYKSKGGGWKSVSEAKENPPFDPPYKTVKKVVDKSGAVHGPMSIAKHLAKTAAQKQATAKKPLKESRKAEIVKEVVKKKKEEKAMAKDKFEADPTLSSEIMKEDK